MEQFLKRRLKIAALIIIFVVMSVLSLDFRGITGAIVADVEVSDEVQQAFANGEEQVSVIVLLKDDKIEDLNAEEKKEAIREQQQGVLEGLVQEDTVAAFGLLTDEKEFELQRQYESINAFAGELTEEGLQKLRREREVELVVVNKIRQVFLADTIPLINANGVWNISINGKAITGAGETVCVVDTGIDYNHAALGGGLGNKVITGYDFFNDDADPMDDNGHGTHVAGIVASTDSTYRGVAPDAKLVAIKVCNSGGSCPDDDVLAGLEWCVNNAATYNISIISISLGGGQYSSYCDEEPDFAPYAEVVNQAVANNISFVAATGNSGPNSIAGPACLQSVTRVSATTKEDSMASYASRHAFFTDTVAAPGSSITSLNDGGGTIAMSGTSMATPHVSGAIALMKQYWEEAYHKAPTSEEVEQKMIASGLSISDSSTDFTYPRIDVLAMLKPSLTFADASENGSVLSTTMVQIVMQSDQDLSSAVLEWTYPNNSMVNMNIVLTNPREVAVNVSNLDKGMHSYRFSGIDIGGMEGVSALQTFVVDDIPPAIAVQNPSNGLNITGESYNLTATALDAHSYIASVSFNVTNDTTSFLLSAIESNGEWKALLNLSALREGEHLVLAYADDSFENTNQSEVVSFILDRTGPVITLLSPVANSTENSTNNITFLYNVSDNLTALSRCDFYLNDVSNETMMAVKNLEIQTINRTLLNGNYTWKVSCLDVLGNSGNSALQPFQVMVLDQTANQTSNQTDNNQTDNDQTSNETIIANQTVWLNLPAADYLSSNAMVIFNCSANGSNTQANITLFGNWNNGWHADETTLLNDSTSATFVKTVLDGSYSWNCLAYDAAGNSISAAANKTFTIDTSKPTLTNVAASSIEKNSAVISWSTNEKSNSTVQYGTSPALGTVKSITDSSVSHSITLVSLNTSTLYYYAVKSCDSLGNCNGSETFTFTTKAEEASVSPTPAPTPTPTPDSSAAASSASAGGGGGGSGGSTSQETASVGEEETSLEAFDQAEAVEDTPAASVTTAPYSRTLLLAGPEPVEVSFETDDLPIKKIALVSSAEKEVTVSAFLLSEKPAAVSPLDNPYGYLEITTTLAEGELEEALVTFTVPMEWLLAHNYSQNAVVLQTYEGEDWVELDTNLISEDQDTATFQAKAFHFSYFAITSGQERGFGSLITGLFSVVIPGEINAKEYVLFALIMLTVLLLIAYILVSRKQRY